MGYFSQDDIQILCGDNAGDKESIVTRFGTLHKKVYGQLQARSIELSIIRSTANAVIADTVSRHPNDDDDTVLSVQYMRSRGDAVTVEKLMGREEVATINNLIMRLHPVIEVRLAEGGLTVEIMAAPDAWWDQQNLKGKLSIPRHKHDFYSTLMTLEDECRLGFWEGSHLSDMHLHGKYFQHPRILDEWLSTFQPHADWFRVGRWYDIDDAALSENEIATTISEMIETLYPVYLYFLWTSENNYREFIT